jgi:hypothetical protein
VIDVQERAEHGPFLGTAIFVILLFSNLPFGGDQKY